MGEMDEAIREFLIESQEGFDQLDRDLVELEKNPDSEVLLSRIFRVVHTIKGTGGVLGFDKLSSVAHVGENLLSRLRDHKLRLDGPITTALLRLIDALRTLVSEVAETGVEGEADYSDVTAVVATILENPQNGSAEASQTESTPAGGADLALGQILAGAAVSSETLESPPQQQRGADSRQLREVLVGNQEVAPETVSEALQTQKESREKPASSTIRVDVGLLDKVMNLVGELVLARNQILQFTTGIKDTSFLGTAQRLNLITTELQEGVMKTRMQPIGNVWNKLPRLVRDLAVSFGKDVRVEMEGAETELDKTVLEAIKDPMMHMVRNAVDHGIEPPDIRRQANKPAQGRLLLRAFHEGGQVNIEVTDDGAGVDLERVKQKAVERGAITSAQAARLTEREALNLVFLPGVSSARTVTNVSGRGVGMDVVRTNIEKIGGTVDIQSFAGQGMTLKVKIPLTLAIIPALIVTSGGERFAIPQVNLLELVRLEHEKATASIENLGGVPVYRLRGRLLPLVDLNRQLHLAPRSQDQSQTVNIVVLHADTRQFGLMVDEINDTEEIVVKPLSKQLKGIASFAGATIMGDGHVALILDVLGLAQMANVVAELSAHVVANNGAREMTKDNGQDTWLVFRVGGNGRMAIPLSLVSRLEEISPEAVESSGDQEVVQYRGHIMPLVRVSSLLKRTPTPNSEMLQVIVYAADQLQVGLVVDDIVDIVEQRIVPEQCGRNAAVKSSAVIQQRVTDILDLDTVIAQFTGSFPSAVMAQGA